MTTQIATQNSALTLIERAATNPDVDVSKMESLFNLYERQLAIEEKKEGKAAEAAFNDAMAKTQGSMQKVIHNKYGYNKQYSYSDLSSIQDACKETWTNNGFSLITFTGESEKQNHVKITVELRHNKGHKEVYVDDWPLDNTGAKGGSTKDPVKAKASSISYARRYMTLAIFDISTGEDRAIDRNPGQQQNPKMMPINDEQKSRLISELSNAGIDHAEFIAAMQIDCIDSLLQGRLKAAINWIEGRKNA